MIPKDNQYFDNWFYNHPKLMALIAFCVILFLSILIAVKDSTIKNNEKERALAQKLRRVEDNIDQILKSSYVTTLSLALTIDLEGNPKDFDEVAKKLLNSNPNINGVEMAKDGVINYVYPYERNNEALGLNVLEYEISKKEALYTIEQGKMYFAGPFYFKQKGLGIIGRLPIFIDNQFWGFSAVIIDLDTFLKKSGMRRLNKDGYHAFLSKINPNTGEREFFNAPQENFDINNAIKLRVEDAGWEIYLININHKTHYLILSPFVIFGLFLALLFAFLTFLILKKPAQLQHHIRLQTRKLLNSEIKYRAIFQEVGLSVVHLDENEQLIEVNGKFLNSTGFTFAEVTNFRFSDLIKTNHDVYSNILDHEKFEGHLICKNKSEICVRVINSTLNLNNRKTHILLIEDITEKKLSEKKLKDLRSQMEMAIRLSKLGYWEWDLASDSITWSNEMYELFGFDKNTQLTRNLIANSVHEDDVEEYEQQLRNILSTRKGSTFEGRIKTEDNKVKHMLARVDCDLNDFGELAKIKGTLLDITDKKEILINLQHSYQMVVEQNERFLNFSYIISHNLRAHSSNIQGIIELIKDIDDKEEELQMFNLLENVTKSLDETLSDLNEVVRVRQDKEGIIENVPLFPFIKKVENILKREIKVNRIYIINEIPRDATISFNSSYLESILLNIISNVIKFSNPDVKSEIKLTYQENKSYKIVKVEDNGRGMDLETNNSDILGMYSTFKDFKNSRGISLFVSNNQMQSMGGKIEVKSELTEGSEFTLYFKK
ncbi:hypothetical protein SAMN04488096_10348 [Mesonia phycicola]|uniref:histidine kinase n=1 Tax=Mesonia phycicola TaxID=579105 RepID=A0A1M6CLX9_9FLAO|nr:ATP-binding protein [Mesonia phycicola]SHI61718.1 hypothetical protein SAMN04488096_10348 [Mesonia phycicola]